jgi:Flp pilus assembly protein TadB
MGFRFILQPIVASLLAIRDGIKDARGDRSPYFWTVLTDPSRRQKRIIEGIRAVARVLILGAVMDVIYQLIALHGIRPLQTVVIAVVLAFVPYMIVRGPAARVAKYYFRKKAAHDEPRPSHGG